MSDSPRKDEIMRLVSLLAGDPITQAERNTRQELGAAVEQLEMELVEANDQNEVLREALQRLVDSSDGWGHARWEDRQYAMLILKKTVANREVTQGDNDADGQMQTR